MIKGKRGSKRKRGMQFIPYDYETAYQSQIDKLNELFVEEMFKHRKESGVCPQRDNSRRPV